MVKTNKITDSFLLSDVSKAGKVYAWCLFAFAIVSNFSISLTQTSLSIALICAIFLYKEKKLELHDVELIRPFLFLAVAGILSIFKADLKISKALDRLLCAKNLLEVGESDSIIRGICLCPQKSIEKK
jgi:hypothetical protein